jgi:PAS domain S-box-containing protein
MFGFFKTEQNQETGLFRSTLGRRIAIAVFASIIAIEIIILIPSYLRQTDSLLAELERQGELLIDILRDSGHLDQAEAKQHAAIIQRSERITGVTIIPGHGVPKISSGSVPSLPDPDQNSNLMQYQRSPDGLVYDVYWPAAASMYHHGIALRFDASHVDQELTAYVTRISLLVLVVSLFVTLMTLWVLKRQVLESLFALRSGLLKGGGRDATVPQKGLARDDELGDLYRSVRTMLGDVNKAHADDKNTLEKFNDELEARVEKRTEELRQNEIRFQSFANAASDWFWEMDEQLRFSYFSDRFTEITGVEQSALLGKTRQETGIPYLTDTLWKNHLDDLAHKRQFQNFVHPRTQTDGSVVHLSINGLPIYDDEGNFRGYRGTGKDVTEQTENEISLQQAKSLAESANVAKSEFLSAMSHELRTPLNAVFGYGQIMLTDTDSPLNDDHRENVEQILSGARHLLELIDQVLDLSDIEAASLLISAVPIALDDICRECIEVIEVQATKTGQITHSEIRTKRTVRVDYNRLRQVILIMLSNAVKYSAPGDTISLFFDDAPDGNVRIIVSDTGPGIAAEDQSKTFEPFNRLGRENGKIPGAGIGLTIAKRLVGDMGGTIGVQSEVGNGSTFWIKFPAIDTVVAD